MSFRVGLFVAALCAAWCGTAMAVPLSQFNADAEGWQVVDLPFPTVGSPPTPLGSFPPMWSATGGNPDGHIWTGDPSRDVFYWSAPAAFLGDQSASYGGNLSFDLQYISGSSFFSQEDVVLVGAGRTLVFDTTVVPDTTWRTYTVGLTETGWRFDSLGGPLATQADMQAVLGSLDALYIRGEYRAGLDDVGRLDNVELFQVVEDQASDFGMDADGWQVADLRYRSVGSPPAVLGNFPPMWSATGGNPDGHIWIDDPTSNVFYWSAPAPFLGDKSASYGASLMFDLRYVLGSYLFHQEDVVLVGAGRTLVFDAAVVPDGDWRNYAVGLTETGWRLDSLTGPAATQDDMQAVLADLQALYIRGEFRGDLNDIGSLDNVRLMEVPPPLVIIGSHDLPGDYNDNGTVDAADYLVWRRNAGTFNVLPNDPDGGLVDADKYNTWRSNFGAMASSGAAVAAPEPAAFIMLLGGCLAASTCRSRRRQV